MNAYSLLKNYKTCQISDESETMNQSCKNINWIFINSMINGLDDWAHLESSIVEFVFTTKLCAQKPFITAWRSFIFSTYENQCNNGALKTTIFHCHLSQFINLKKHNNYICIAKNTWNMTSIWKNIEKSILGFLWMVTLSASYLWYSCGKTLYPDYIQIILYLL